MTINLNDFLNQVAAMREKQKEYFKSRDASWAVKNIILAESKALEQNVDRLIRVHQEMEEGQLSLIDQLDEDRKDH